MFNLKGKRAFVTGASQGLGEVVAKGLSSHDVKLALFARNADKLESVRLKCENPNQHISVPMDLFDQASIYQGVAKGLEFLGGVDIVVHCAGGGLGAKSALLSHDEFLKLFSLNLGSSAEINRLVVPEMSKTKQGNIVHIGSIASSEAVGSVGYNTVKAGISAYVRSLGRELAPLGIVVTGLLPGGFHAPDNAMDRFQKKNPADYEKFLNDRLPRGFMGQAEEMLPMLLLLCSDSASMMGGCLVPMDAAEGRSYLK